MAANSMDKNLRREAPKWLLACGTALVVMVIGIVAFYVYNGGWKTAAQQDEYYKHNVLPLLAAKHGDREALDAENAARKRNGESPLEAPKSKSQAAGDARQQLADVRRRLAEKMGGQPQ